MIGIAREIYEKLVRSQEEESDVVESPPKKALPKLLR